MRKLAALFAVLFISGAALAIDIPTDCRVPNQSPGYCCWASLETLGRTHGIPQLYNLVEARKKDPDSMIAYGSGPHVQYVVRPKNYDPSSPT
jgi:hypothetical protein